MFNWSFQIGHFLFSIEQDIQNFELSFGGGVEFPPPPPTGNNEAKSIPRTGEHTNKGIEVENSLVCLKNVSN